MKTEKQCEPYEKYLFADSHFTNEEIVQAKLNCCKRYNDKFDKDLYNKFINWQREENEIVVFTLYAYADFEIPKQLDIIFQLDKPDNYIQTNYILTQSIYEGWVPTDKVEHGHKHLCIFRFEDTIPEIINLLPTATVINQYTPPSPYHLLGFCNSHDFKAVTQRIEETR